MPRTCRLSLVLLLAVLTFACRQWPDNDHLLHENKLVASTAYLTFFGPPPTVADGFSSAYVGYFPRHDNPALVTPIPLFFSSTRPQISEVLTRLLAIEEPGLLAAGLFNPFPQGSEVRGVRTYGDLAIVDLTRQAGRNTDRHRKLAVVAALSHTLAQFPGVKRVVVTTDGFPLLSSNVEYVPSPLQVAAPGVARPVVLQQHSRNDSDKETQLTLSFDRPVCLKEIKMFDLQGNVAAVRGDSALCRMEYEFQTSNAHNTRQFHVLWNAIDGLHQASTGEVVLPIVKQPSPHDNER